MNVRNFQMLLSFMMFWFMLSCRPGAGYMSPGMSGGASTLMNMDFSAVSSKINAYQLNLTASNDCASFDGSKVNGIHDLTSSSSINFSLSQNCNYSMQLSLGNKSSAAAPQQPQGANLAEAAKSVIDSACVSCHNGQDQSDLRTLPAIEAKSSTIIEKVLSKAMPPPGVGTLTAEQVKVFEDWKAGSTNNASNSASQGNYVAYYDMNQPLAITDLAGKSSVNLTLDLYLTQAGKSAGVGQGNIQSNPNNQNNAKPNPEPQQTPVTLEGNKNFQLKGPDGSTTLAQLFTREYMLLDISQSSCIPCRSLAGKLADSEDYKRLTSGPKCSAVTVLGPNESSSWPYSKGHTYDYTSGISGALSAYGDFRGTPTVILIDRKGNVQKSVVGADAGGVVNMLRTYCE